MALSAPSLHSRPPIPGTASPVEPLRKLQFLALGTRCEVQYAAPFGEPQAAEFERAAVAWVEAFEAKFSRFRPTSLVGRINAAAGREWVEVDGEMCQMLALCDTLHAMTRGVLDPTSAPLIELWNWKAQPRALPSDARIAAARRLVGWSKVQRTADRIFLPEPGMALDFGGFGKEYAVDLVAQVGAKHGITDLLVDFGHDLRAVGAPPGRPAWHIGLEDPQRPGRTAGSIGVTGRGVASSGDYVRCCWIDGRRYGHILDPRTGWPVANGCTQATVVANTCLQAGVLSTTAFVLGLREGLEFIQSFPGTEGIIVAEHSRAQTRGFLQYVVSA